MELKNSDNHFVLIDTQAFNKADIIMTYPETFNNHPHDKTSFILPYCFRNDYIIPYNDVKKETSNLQVVQHRDTSNKWGVHNGGLREKDENKGTKLQNNESLQNFCLGGSSKTDPIRAASQMNNYQEVNYTHMTLSNKTTRTTNNDKHGTKKTENKKSLIRSSIRALQKVEDLSVLHLATTIQSYQTFSMDFTCLHQAIQQLTEAERELFFSITVPCILSLVLDTPNIITQAIPILKRNMAACITMSQLQAACLLANAFMCTFKKPPCGFNSINFYSLFSKPRDDRIHSQVGKLLCLFNYFKRVASESFEQRGLISIERKCNKNQKKSSDWLSFNQSLCKLSVFKSGAIEDARGFLQVDFADELIGGGVLRTGAVQEEIRFIISPETIVACLVAEKMGDHECIVLRGCEQFNTYKGYGRTFSFKEDLIDTTPRDSWRRISTCIVAIDALKYRDLQQQFQPHFLLREINKAFCGFSVSQFTQSISLTSKSHLSPVATGNWGCGIFKGNLQLKAMVQLLASSMAPRNLRYFVFGEEAFGTQLEEVCHHLENKRCTVARLFQLLLSYWPPEQPHYDLFTHIKLHLAR